MIRKILTWKKQELCSSFLTLARHSSVINFYMIFFTCENKPIQNSQKTSKQRESKKVHWDFNLKTASLLTLTLRINWLAIVKRLLYLIILHPCLHGRVLLILWRKSLAQSLWHFDQILLNYKVKHKWHHTCKCEKPVAPEFLCIFCYFHGAKTSYKVFDHFSWT